MVDVQDLQIQQKYLVTFTVGYDQKNNIDAAVKKVSGGAPKVIPFLNASLMTLGSEWFAKRFLHPDIVARYEFIFIWDEDLGVEHFDAEE
ncbi:hypothetical protein BHE74_00001676 [Ensete ventricosum]|uniref:Uncharacterized protein n=1 Tax=Ensete ventricosum TaxID=4639 RepID=A0A427B7X9_ENSVE|nr:hypothetical protein B296_00005396 [Ensete ventricosum]RWW23960.1 hypothetical protein GW17_00011771 [Ensete ventricosum]RWW89385.1 hypothetical protein BHE74_00001676 [Ensete ventricosum]RZR86472.1 hypothetical protein BHM03_00013675 [Ensete ventricosum]